jgi:holo-[acyl-carrier protein] synthase
MILGIGIDVVHVKRIKHWLEVPGLVERFYHPQEIAECGSRGSSGPLSLAARFAAKEALGKALGTGLSGMRLRDIQVVNDRYGKPGIVLYGEAAGRLEKMGGKRVHLSLTHESDNAIAMVAIED